MAASLWQKTVLIFGCGSILWGDDGFGPAVIQHLKDHHVLPQDVLALDVGTSIRDILFDLILSEPKPQKIIVIDAVDYPDRQPGEVFEIPVEGIPAKKISDFSLHQFPTVNLLQELKEHSQIDITIVVAQIQEIPAEVRPGLTPTLQAAIEPTCQRILSALGNPDKGKHDV